MAAAFHDHFSAVAAEYAASRPSYPSALFTWIGDACARHALAWDCATGSGQAARSLATVFDHVIASDASAAQLASAEPAATVEYRCFPAEDPDLTTGSVDCVTVGQALHWFDCDRFYAQVRRVLTPDGLIVAWSYGRNVVDDCPDATAIIDDFHDRVLAPFWPAERAHVLSGYADLPFPFDPLPTPGFTMRQEWTVANMLAYLGTWSAVARYRAVHGTDPRDLLRDRLVAAWGEPMTRTVSWPLAVRAGMRS